MKHLLAITTFLLLSSSVIAQKESGPPQVRLDSNIHWEWFTDTWPIAEQVKMVQVAAEAGDAQAQFRLALMHDAGEGVIKNPALAAKWFHKAAEQGHVEAQYNLATMYDSGHGVTQDYTEAVRWYRAAAEQGYSSAQKNLAVKYGLGQGVPQSDIEAYIWSAIAALSGDEGAIDNRNLAASKLSSNQLEAAQNWTAKRYQVIKRNQS